MRPYHTEVYRGLIPCPRCGSTETGTSTISTSEKSIVFECDGCGHVYQVRTTLVRAARCPDAKGPAVLSARKNTTFFLQDKGN